MWYLIVSFPDLCNLTYLDRKIHPKDHGLATGDRDHDVLFFSIQSYTTKGLFFLLTTNYINFVFGKKIWKMLPENPEYTAIRNGDVILTL